MLICLIEYRNHIVKALNKKGFAIKPLILKTFDQKLSPGYLRKIRSDMHFLIELYPQLIGFELGIVKSQYSILKEESQRIALS
jgi:hypothetical protein